MADRQVKSGRPSAIGASPLKLTSIDFKGMPSGDSIDLRATLIDEDGNPVPSRWIMIKYKSSGGVEEFIGANKEADERGVVAVNTRYHAEFRGDTEYGRAEAGMLRPPKIAFEDPTQAKRTKLALDVVYLDDSAQLTAKLTDLDGNPLPNETISFEGMNDPEHPDWTGTAVTDDQGVATVTAPKYNWYHAVFEGDYDRLYYDSEAWFTVLPEPVLTLDVGHDSSAVKLRAKLTDSSGNPLASKPIYFGIIFDGERYGEAGFAVTDETGVAAVTIRHKAIFQGDDDYALSWAWAQFPVEGPAESPCPSLSPYPSQSPCPSSISSAYLLLPMALVGAFLVARRRSARTSE